jgi:3-methyl-2-oxobutanoate hydroxymethyltransferase
MGIETIKKITKFCNTKRPLVCLTAYTRYMGEILDGNCDLILVGDSLSMVIYGNNFTKNVTLQTMINHGKAVGLAVKKSVLVVDMPKGSYETSPIIALKNAKKIMRETNCDAVKVEGGLKIKKIIKTLVKNKIPVMGHIGLMPQQANKLSDYKVKGRSEKEEKSIINDLTAVQESGAFSVVIESVPKALADKLNKISTIKTIGIGASKQCDGQVLVTEDLLGYFTKTAKFVKQYDDIRGRILKSVHKFKSDIIKRKFPTDRNTY